MNEKMTHASFRSRPKLHIPARGRGRHRLQVLRRIGKWRRQQAKLILAKPTDDLDIATDGARQDASAVPRDQFEPVSATVADGLLEAPRADVSLRLIGGPIKTTGTDGKPALGSTFACGTWEYPIMDEHRRCYAGILRGAVSEQARRKCWDMVFKNTPWEQPMQTWGPMPRKTAWMCDLPCTCLYGYGGMKIKPVPLMTSWMRELLAMLMPLCGLTREEQWPNSCNLNLYENNDHSVSWHSDNEKMFNGKFQDMPIISLSLGQERRFELKAPGISDDVGKVSTKMDLRDGDLCTMEGMFQKYYDHRVPREEKKVAPRINITWRWMVDHEKECPLHNSDPRLMPYGGGFANKASLKGKGKGKDKGGKGGSKGKDKGKTKTSSFDKGKGKSNMKGKGRGK